MICCHQFVLDCNRREEVRFVATNLCSIVTEGKKHYLLPPCCARLSQKERSTTCCHQFVLDCHRRKKYDLFPPKGHRREEIRFVATNLCSIVTEGKKYDLLPPICARLSQIRNTICCYNLDYHRREEVRFVATNLCSHRHRRQEVRFVAINLCSIVTEGKKDDLLPPICARLSQKGRSTICCQQFVLDCHRREERRFVATNLCSIVTEGKKHDLLPPICAPLSQKGRSTICCHQFVLDCHRREEVRFVATWAQEVREWLDLFAPPPARWAQEVR